MDYKENVIEGNTRLNLLEFYERKIILKSSPETIFIQVSGPCNSSCVFCSRGSNYEMFDLNLYRKRFEKRLFPFLSKCRRLVLTGSGEFLQSPEAEKILDFFNNEFPYAEKNFATNGVSLSPDICKMIVDSGNKYVIHVSLHASKQETHSVITRTGNFHSILVKIKYLLDLRKSSENIKVYLVFIANTLNIGDLPDFIRLASVLGVDKVKCGYNYIYIPTQKYLSCFFIQSLTNRIFTEAEELARNLNIDLELPPKFGLKEYPVNDVCKEGWVQVMVDTQGHILPCDASEDFNEHLQEKDFMDIWNGQNYQNLRKILAAKDTKCFKHCFRANPSSVNNFNSHVIYRGKDIDSEIDVLWGDNF